jgi:hypothetical protein
MIKVLILLTIISTTIMGLIIEITYDLEGKLKDNKFRKWWSNHIVDLDNRYHD